MIKLVKLASSVILLSLASAVAHAGLIFSDDRTEILGVDGIDIGGGAVGTFDFVAGSFDDLFGGVPYSFDTVVAAQGIADMFGDVLVGELVSAVPGCSARFGFCQVLLPSSIRPPSGPLAQLRVDVFGFVNLTGRIPPTPDPNITSGDFSVPAQLGGNPGDFITCSESDVDCGRRPGLIVWAVLRPTAAAAVPEPSMIGLLGLSLFGLGFARKIQHKA